MDWVKGFALVTCLATPLSVIEATSATAATMDRTPAAAEASQARMIRKVAMSDAEKKAKATDCSKQADAKKLHGEARRKFRAECKKG